MSDQALAKIKRVLREREDGPMAGWTMPAAFYTSEASSI